MEVNGEQEEVQETAVVLHEVFTYVRVHTLRVKL